MEILGRLTANAEVKTLPDERKVTNFTLALNKRYKDKSSGEMKQQTTYVQCSYWVNPNRAKILRKGAWVQVQGELSGTNAWVGTDGQIRSNILVHVNDFFVLTGTNKSSDAQQQTAPTNVSAIESPTDDLPF